MNPNFYWNAIKRRGTDFTLQRGENSPVVCRGLPNREKAYIGFAPDTDILRGDILLNPAGDKFFVVDVQTQFVENTAMQVMAYYQTERERNRNMNTGNTYNVQNAHNVMIGDGSQTVDYGNAVAGNQGTVNYNSDSSTLGELYELVQPRMSEFKEDIDRLIGIVQKIESGAIRVDKSAFSSVKAIIALIPGLGSFLKKKFPAAFEDSAK